MGRSPCCSKVGLRRGPWSTKEDNLLTAFIQEHGEGQWRSLPKKAGLLRCGKSCRLRWMNYLRPGIKRGNITEDEEDLIVRLHRLLGNRWSLIAGRLPGRTDNEIKNHWNTHLLKKLKNAGIHPKPHKDLPKPAKTKKSAAVEKKRKQKKEPVILEENLSGPVQREQGISNTSDHEEDKGINPPPPPPPPAKIKVFSPKPIRVSPEFSRTSSYDSLASGESNSDGGEAARVVYMPVVASLPPLFELEYGGGEEDDFLSGGYILPVLRHSDSISSDVNMLEKVYDEYLQLL